MTYTQIGIYESTTFVMKISASKVYLMKKQVIMTTVKYFRFHYSIQNELFLFLPAFAFLVVH